MSDEEALLAAIAAHPNEDTPRLVYADWLDEHDRPIRAEFIRVQCALKPTENRSAEEQRKLLDRQRHLVENHRRDILGPLGADLTVFDVTFERGFASELNITALLFVQCAPVIGELRPPPRIRIRNLNKSIFDTTLRRPEANLVVELLAAFEVGEYGAYQLADCSRLTRLEVLDFGPYNTIGNSGLEALAFSDNLPALIDLRVRGNEISDVGVERLVAAPLWRRLRRLDLSTNPLTDASADRLVKAPINAIEHLSLQHSHFGEAARRLLSRKFGACVELF